VPSWEPGKTRDVPVKSIRASIIGSFYLYERLRMLLFNAAFIEGASVFDDLQCEIGKQSAAFGERRTARVKNQTKRGGGATRRLSRSIGAASLKLRPLSRGQRDDPDNLCVRLSRRRNQFNPTIAASLSLLT
jgi:hypothetical protein